MSGGQSPEIHRSPYDESFPGHVGFDIGALDVPEAPLPPADMLRDELDLPQIGQLDVVRRFVRLSTLNFGIENGTYPLGSCTMKYNPKVNDTIASLPGFTGTHPEQSPEQVQGNLRLLYELQKYLSEITGMDATALSPMAGAQGELAGVLVMRAYFEAKGELEARRKILVPDSAHGTNPATAAMAGFEVVEIKSDSEGNVDLVDLASKLGPDVAGMMLTQPSTLGLFDPNILEMANMLHAQGALFYGDGANMNALVGRVKPADLGFDVMHLNLHKTFSTPHGGGGPGAAPICVREALASYLPAPIVGYDPEKGYYPIYPPQTIGRLGEAFGNFGVLVRAHAYIRALGAEGLRAISEAAVINANYVRTRLEDSFDIPYQRSCMHEFIISIADMRRKYGITAHDVARMLIEEGFHPPTMYFPLIVQEALLIEPTESETKAGLDMFIEAMLRIYERAINDPEYVKEAPHNTPVRQPDEATAARNPVLHWSSTE